MSNSIIIRNGSTFDFSCPHNSSYSIKVIAHALSNICRANGHTKFFYSVAQHSVLMSHVVPPEFALVGLMYKSAQAFTGFLPDELRATLPGHHELEMDVLNAIFVRFGLPTELPNCVQTLSLVLEATERRDVLPKCADKSHELADIKPLDRVITTWFPSEAARHFLTRYKELTRPTAAGSGAAEVISIF